MWFSDFRDAGDFHVFLAHTGDRNTAGPSFVNFRTKATRDIPVEVDEGGHFSAHILVSRDPDSAGCHFLLVEKVPNLHFSALRDHLGWICRADRFGKPFRSERGELRRNHPVFELLGYQATTVGDALKTGLLQDVELVSRDMRYDDGLDEDGVITEVARHVKLAVGRRVTENEAEHVIRQALNMLPQIGKRPNTNQMYVRIKTESGHVRRTEVESREVEHILEAAFVHNEFVDAFDRPLTQRYDTVRQDMLEKMLEIAARSERALSENL